MCIAIFSESGVGYPTKEIFERCWKINDDGAGYAYLTVDDEWHIKKGLMTFDAFWEAWQAESFGELNTVVIHFRLGTSGKQIGSGFTATCHPGCTHPFPVTDEDEKLFETEITTKRIVMHNGVVGQGKGDLSDTMVAIKEYFDPLIPYLKDKKVVDVLTELSGANDYHYGNRWWVADGADTYLMGDWILDEESKIWYSKHDYLQRAERVPSTTTKVHRRSPTVVVDKTLFAKDYLTKKLRVFSWIKWSKWNFMDYDETPTTTMSTFRHPSTSTPETTPADKIVEVYNAKHKCIALIDGVTGETIYENDDTSSEEESKHCVDCGATIGKSQTNDGLCPYCYNQLWPITGWVDKDEKASCPSCGESNYLIDSTFTTGDSECCQCGCLFWSTISGSDGIVGWNEDTKAYFQEQEWAKG